MIESLLTSIQQFLASNSVIFSATVAGLIASGHCVSMCGGISISLRSLAGGKLFQAVILPNLARISCYALMGLISFNFFSQLLKPSDDLLMIMRLLPAFALIAMGALLVFRKKTPAASCSQCPSCPSKKQNHRTRWLAWCWGLIPCPMVMTMLVGSLGCDNQWQASSFMIAFGLGTLPALLGLGVATEFFSRWLPTFSLKNWSYNRALLLLIAGLWTGTSSWVMQNHDHHHHHGQALEIEVPQTSHSAHHHH